MLLEKAHQEAVYHNINIVSKLQMWRQSGEKVAIHVTTTLFSQEVERERRWDGKAGQLPRREIRIMPETAAIKESGTGNEPQKKPILQVALKFRLPPHYITAPIRQYIRIELCSGIDRLTRNSVKRCCLLG